MILAVIQSIALPLGILVLISSGARYIHYIFFNKYFKFTFEDAPVWSLFYFSFWTAVVIVVFPSQIYELFSQISFVGYLVLIVLLFIIFPIIYRTMRLSTGNPEWLADIFPTEGMLSLEERYIFAKIGDVVFQQCVAGGMILTLLNGGLEYPQIVVIFITLFTLAHLYLFRTAGIVWGMHYSAYAALGGFAFPFLIIFVQGGIGYAIVLHMLFYVFSAIFFAKLPRPSTAISSHLA